CLFLRAGGVLTYRAMLREIQCLRVAPLVMLGLCAAWLVGPPAAPGKAALPFRIVPGPVPRKGGAPAPGGAGRLTLPGLTTAADPQAAIDAARPFIFDSSTTIPRGRRLTRLLVFGPLPDRWKGLLLHFSFIEIGSEAHTLSLPFHRQILAG